MPTVKFWVRILVGAKFLANEDLTGLSGPSPVPSNPVSISGAPNRGNADFTPEAAQVAHSPKPPANFNIKPYPHIQQPRK
ncbi:hypothetical protein evm_010209 [Chilo suppressalis]|nr:hypothetical protein evm_010209 [Chilo suppressalis]